MNRLTEFEVEQVASKWAKAGLSSEMAITMAVRHAEVLLSERNIAAVFHRRPEEEVSVMVDGKPTAVSKKAWDGVWSEFDRAMKKFDSAMSRIGDIFK